MNEQQLFVTGMFRSGTTLAARLLNAHPRIVFASDPFARLFKAFRNTVAERVWGTEKTDAAAPLGDYYFDTDQQALMTRIQETPLTLPIGRLSLANLRDQIEKASAPYSPLIAPYLSELKGNTFAELFERGFDIIEKAYGKTDSHWVGFKEVWTGEFVPHLLQQFPRAKAIHIVRDPRAVCASKNVSEEKYPWLFLIRQWRKLTTFAWKHTQYSFANHDRVLVVRYESLIQNPEEQIQRICTFLNIDLHSDMLDPQAFKNGQGKKWKQNSSYVEGIQKFNVTSVDRWKSMLDTSQVQMIENLCQAEMKTWDYAPVTPDSSSPFWQMIFEPPIISEENLASWIIPYSQVRLDEVMREMSLEYVREQVLASSEEISDVLKRKLCLFEDYFSHCRTLVSNESVS